MSIFYRPDDGVAADFIPFYREGEYHLFYLKDYRDAAGHGEGTPWFHLLTRDFVTFEDLGEALARGPEGSQDVWVFTGSAIEHEGMFHIFYTGHNGHFAGTDRPVQAVMHATSPDLRAWTKDEGFLFVAPTDGYEKDDWRDPFVFWNDEAGEWWMLLAARRTAGPSRNRGCLALAACGGPAASRDLKAWEVREPLWAPDLYFTHECPDCFRIGDWWYLIYSTFTERSVTHYRMSRSLAGPWLCPANDTFDGRAFYAAKTAGCCGRFAGETGERFIFGWLPTRDGETDSGGWQWGGELVVHELLQQSDGTLKVRAPKTVLEAFVEAVATKPSPVLGVWRAEDHSVGADAVGRHSVLSLGAMPDECLIETTVEFAEETAAFGLMVRWDEGADRYYQVRFEPPNQRFVIDRWPRPGDQPFMLERPLAMRPGKPISLRVVADGTCLVVYVNDEVALSCRMYDQRQGSLGLFVTEGRASFGAVGVKVRG
jgi:beta-fructofuranosidase